LGATLITILEMKQPAKTQLLKALNGLEAQLEFIRSLVTDAAAPQEWIDTKEFAHLTNLKPKTVTNYAGTGQIKKIKKSGSGHYLIHISELHKWTQ